MDSEQDNISYENDNIYYPRERQDDNKTITIVDVNDYKDNSINMDMIIVPGHACDDDGGPIDMFSGINSSSMLMTKHQLATELVSENSSNFCVSTGKNVIDDLKVKAEEEASIISKLKSSDCKTIQDSYDIVFKHLVDRADLPLEYL